MVPLAPRGWYKKRKETQILGETQSTALILGGAARAPSATRGQYKNGKKLEFWVKHKIPPPPSIFGAARVPSAPRGRYKKKIKERTLKSG